jgi:prefoldin subunit 5
MPEHMRSTDPEVRTARELAEHGAEIKHLQSDMDRMTEDMAEVKKALQEISKTLAEAQGGWKMLMVVGGLGAAIGSSIAWIFTHMKH